MNLIKPTFTVYTALFSTVGWNTKRGDCIKGRQERLKGERVFDEQKKWKQERLDEEQEWPNEKQKRLKEEQERLDEG